MVTIHAPNFERDIHCIFGLTFDATNLNGALKLVREAVTQQTRLTISTPNLNFLVASQADSAFRSSVVGSQLSLADGMPIVWLASLTGVPIRHRVAGSTLFEELRTNQIFADSPPIKIYFFGGPDGIAKQAAERINQTDTNGLGSSMICVGYASPGFGSVQDMSTTAIIERINESRADFVVVSLGARKGQEWIEQNSDLLNASVISHLGAVVNMVAGTIVRAPVWMQRVGLEWAWRIKEEPSLWRRYRDDGLGLLRILCTRVLPLLLYQQFIKFLAKDGEPPKIEFTLKSGAMRLRLQGILTARTLAPIRSAFQQCVDQGLDIDIDLQASTRVDSAFLGILMLLHDYQRRTKKKMRILCSSKVFQYSAYLHGVGYLLVTNNPQTPSPCL